MITMLFVNCYVAIWNVYPSTKWWAWPEQDLRRCEYLKRLVRILRLSTFSCRSCAVTKLYCGYEDSFPRCESWSPRGRRIKACLLVRSAQNQMVLFINRSR